MVLRQRSSSFSLPRLLVETFVERQPLSSLPPVRNIPLRCRRRRCTAEDFGSERALLRFCLLSLLFSLPLTVSVDALPVPGQLLVVNCGATGKDKPCFVFFFHGVFFHHSRLIETCPVTTEKGDELCRRCANNTINKSPVTGSPIEDASTEKSILHART